jgi:hypothetical protein
LDVIELLNNLELQPVSASTLMILRSDLATAEAIVGEVRVGHAILLAETIREVCLSGGLETGYFHQTYCFVLAHGTSKKRSKLQALRHAKGALEDARLISSVYLS